MFSAFWPRKETSNAQDPAIFTSATAVADVVHGLHSLHLSMPGAFSSTNNIDDTMSSPTSPHASIDDVEALVTAATLTAAPTVTSSHRLFSSSAEFYRESSAGISASVRSLSLADAMESVEAVVASKPRPDRPGRRFGSSSRPHPPILSLNATASSSLPPTSPLPGKLQVDEEKAIQRLSKAFTHHYTQVFEDDLTSEERRVRLDAAAAYLRQGLEQISNLEKNAHRRTQRKQAQVDAPQALDQSLKEKRDCLREQMRSLFAKTCALYATIPSESPVKLEAEHLYDRSLLEMDQVNQVLIILAVVCNLVMGMSVAQSNFLIGVVTLLVKLGMSTAGSCCSNSSNSFTRSQNEIIADMPSSLADALKKFDVEGRFDLYATCPSCSFTNKARPLDGYPFYDFPQTCENVVVGEEGRSVCGTSLLKHRPDGLAQPIKPYLVNSLSDYIMRCLSDSTYLEQSNNAMDKAAESLKAGLPSTSTSSVFDAEFIRNFKGPDKKLFVHRGEKIRLALSIHSDFFNPNGTSKRGSHDSVGIISCANLALDPSIRYLPEYMFVAGIIPGPKEPSYDEIDHFLRPVIEQFSAAWRPGFEVTRTALSESSVTVEVAIVLSVNDLPAARKIAGLQGSGSGNFICTICRIQGKNQIFNVDHAQWTSRNVQELRKWATAYRDASTENERKAIFKTHNVRWSSFWLLDYWDPTKMLVVDAMHCILEGVVHYHCRYVLRLDASATKVSDDGFKYAFEWPWNPYDPNEGSIRVKENHIPTVSKIQEALCLSLEGDSALSLDQLWTRLENQGRLESLHYVAESLELPMCLHNIPATISTMYVSRAQKRSKAKEPRQIKFPFGIPATEKNHFIALLLSWRLDQAFSNGISLPPTGTPETLAHIQDVIRETVTPSWINSVPRNYGQARAGSIKADEWRTLGTLYLPIALITLWGEVDGHPPPDDSSEAALLKRALDHTMALFQATIIACRHTATVSRTAAFRTHFSQWVRDLRGLYPYTREGNGRPNIHAAGHIYDFLTLFGPVHSWWCFPFERLIGTLQKVNTNDHIGGEMESTVMKTIARTANIRRWLRRPDCPEAVRQVKVMFDKCFAPVNAGMSRDRSEKKGERLAYVSHHGVNFSGINTHAGNATIFYRPTVSKRPIAGQIQWIENSRTRGDTQPRLHVKPYHPLPGNKNDPFRPYPHLLATTYLSALQDQTDIITLDQVIAHAAHYDFSRNRSVFVNMSRH